MGDTRENNLKARHAWDSALIERSFPPGTEAGTTTLSWNGNFSEIPPVMIARMRLPRAPT